MRLVRETGISRSDGYDAAGELGRVRSGDRELYRVSRFGGRSPR